MPPSGVAVQSAPYKATSEVPNGAFSHLVREYELLPCQHLELLAFFFLIFSMLAVMEPLCGDNLCFLAGDNSQPGACPVVERHLNSLLKDQLVSSCS